MSALCRKFRQYMLLRGFADPMKESCEGAIAGLVRAYGASWERDSVPGTRARCREASREGHAVYAGNPCPDTVFAGP